ncbi:hypothetical protein NKR19_g9807 [Coniochaeta hoffmannii]|uniref:Uncharacterized protein n=1 Tax=Coniochaeta hoffmannii TaxID=91930 RepID=A0AA38RHD2_9PEZI|nr:hypothetical protein NKR19_g9807 [Coniochaeta hoffmannii]
MHIAVSVAERKKARVKYGAPQSTLTPEGWKESQAERPLNSLQKNDQNTEKHVGQLLQQGLKPKKLEQIMEKVAKDLDLPDSSHLLSLLAWPVLHEEFANFKRSYLSTHSTDAARPYHRMVRQQLLTRVSSHMEKLSVESYHVKDGFNGQPLGFWPADKPHDVTHQYAHMIIRIMWRLWTDASHDPVGKWLRDPTVVGTVDSQVWILYHALLYKQTEEEVTAITRTQ